jgi:hypothetical protein
MSKRNAVCFSPPVGKKGFENTTVFLFARREVRVGTVAEEAGVIFFSRGKRPPKKGEPPSFLVPLPIAE